MIAKILTLRWESQTSIQVCLRRREQL